MAAKKTKKKARKPHRNPKGIASLKEHEGLTVQQRVARVETAVRQLTDVHHTDMKKVREALEDQAKINATVLSALRKAL